MKFVDEFDKNFSDPVRDQPNRRVVTTDYGRVFKLERRDPYGFVYVVWDHGFPPEALSGSYTAFDTAMQALTLWINNNPPKEEKAPPLKYKKAYRDPETGENLKIA